MLKTQQIDIPSQNARMSECHDLSENLCGSFPSRVRSFRVTERVFNERSHRSSSRFAASACLVASSTFSICSCRISASAARLIMSFLEHPRPHGSERAFRVSTFCPFASNVSRRFSTGPSPTLACDQLHHLSAYIRHFSFPLAMYQTRGGHHRSYHH